MFALPHQIVKKILNQKHDLYRNISGALVYLSAFKGELHPLPKITMFCALPQKLSILFLKNDICILKQIVQGTEKWNGNYSRPAVFKLWIKIVKILF